MTNDSRALRKDDSCQVFSLASAGADAPGIARSLLQECQQRVEGLLRMSIRSQYGLVHPLQATLPPFRDPSIFDTAHPASAERFPVPTRMCFAQLRALSPVCGEVAGHGRVSTPMCHCIPRRSRPPSVAKIISKVAGRLPLSTSRPVRTQRGISSKPLLEATVSILRIRDVVRQALESALAAHYGAYSAPNEPWIPSRTSPTPKYSAGSSQVPIMPVGPSAS